MNKETPEQQRIKIAKACGWHGNVNGLCMRPPNTVSEYREVPDYFNDLNAMHDAVMTLPQNLKPKYFAILCSTVSSKITLNGYVEVTEATAAQRAEAFLRTLNL